MSLKTWEGIYKWSRKQFISYTEKTLMIFMKFLLVIYRIISINLWKVDYEFAWDLVKYYERSCIKISKNNTTRKLISVVINVDEKKGGILVQVISISIWEYQEVAFENTPVFLRHLKLYSLRIMNRCTAEQLFSKKCTVREKVWKPLIRGIEIIRNQWGRHKFSIVSQ